MRSSCDEPEAARRRERGSRAAVAQADRIDDAECVGQNASLGAIPKPVPLSFTVPAPLSFTVPVPLSSTVPLPLHFPVPTTATRTRLPGPRTGAAAAAHTGTLSPDQLTRAPARRAAANTSRCPGVTASRTSTCVARSCVSTSPSAP